MQSKAPRSLFYRSYITSITDLLEIQLEIKGKDRASALQGLADLSMSSSSMPLRRLLRPQILHHCRASDFDTLQRIFSQQVLKELGSKLGIPYVYPIFGEDQSGSDFNDYKTIYGTAQAGD